MSYESIDKLQKFLADSVFSYTESRKKAAGRALGTFVEIITFYLLKTWGFSRGMAIERALHEFANESISHNVEFTLHAWKLLSESPITGKRYPLRVSDVFETCEKGKLKGCIVDKNGVLENAFKIFENEDFIFKAGVDTLRERAEMVKLKRLPFAMFECKRVGVEEGMKKGPQTIEKAKQGAYVARAVSKLQRIRLVDGVMGGIYQKSDGTFSNVIPYYELLTKLVDSHEKDALLNFVLSVGVVSNHGNWFTKDTQNKEMRVLAQSYDWLLFLTDRGLSKFITKLLIEPDESYLAVKECFSRKYGPATKRTSCSFTKKRIGFEADKALSLFFCRNITEIESWFNVITPVDKSISDLKDFLKKLDRKESL